MSKQELLNTDIDFIIIAEGKKIEQEFPKYFWRIQYQPCLRAR